MNCGRIAKVDSGRKNGADTGAGANWPAMQVESFKRRGFKRDMVPDYGLRRL